MLRLSKLERNLKILVSMILISVFLASTVYALGVGPTSLDFTVEKGKETQFSEYITVSNPETNPIHITSSVTGSIAQFITVEPQEFDMPAGPGITSGQTRPVQDVKVNFKIPRELAENEYTGEILFTQKAVGGGVLGASAQLGVKVKLTIGKMATAVFPMFMNAIIIILIVFLIISLILYLKRGK